MSVLKSLAALSISSMSILPLAPEVKADDYQKGFYGSIGAGAGTFSDILLVGTPFALAFDPGFSYEGSFGYDFGKHFRADVSYTNTISTLVTDHQAKFGSIILNGYFDFLMTVRPNLSHNKYSYGNITYQTYSSNSLTLEDDSLVKDNVIKIPMITRIILCSSI